MFGVKDHFISHNVPTYLHLKSDELRVKFVNEFNENERKSLVQAVLKKNEKWKNGDVHEIITFSTPTRWKNVDDR